MASASASQAAAAAALSTSQSISASIASASASQSAAAQSTSQSISASLSRSASIASASASQSAAQAALSTSQSIQASIASASASQSAAQAALSTSQSISASIASASASQSVAAALQSQIASQSASISASIAQASQSASLAAAFAQAQSSSISASIAQASESASIAAASASASLYAAAQSSSVLASIAQASQSASIAAASASASLASAFEAAQSSSISASIAQASASAQAAADAAVSASLASSIAAYSSSLANAATSTVSSVIPAPTAATIPSPWVGAGAGGAMINIAEGTTGRALTGGQTTFPDMTYEKCLNWCYSNGFSICGMEYSSECYGGNQLGNGAALSKLSSKPLMPCSGDPSSTCGGGDTLTLFVTPRAINSLNADLNAPVGGATGTVGSVTSSVVDTATGAAGTATATLSSAGSSATGSVSIPAPWQSAGDIAEGLNGRALTGGSISGSDMTYEKCLGWCSSHGYVLCGMEYSQECYGGNKLENGAALSRTASHPANMPCAGNAQQMCGGSAILSLFVTPAGISSLNSDFTAVVGGAATSVSSAANAAPTSVTIPSGWQSVGSIAEGKGGRALTGGSITGSDMTPAKCLTWGQSQGYSLCGVEYSSECYCGNMLQNGAALSKPSTNQAMMCSGDQSQPCGGPDRLDLYATSSAISSLNADLNAVAGGAAGTAASAVSSAANAAPTTPTASLPAGWTSVGTIAEGKGGRALVGGSISGSDMTYAKCLSWGQSQGFALCGLEYSSECFCGNMLMNGAALSKTSTNNVMMCSGDQSQPCGGPDMLTLFATNDAVNALNADLNGFKSGSGPAQPSASAAPLTGQSAEFPSGWAVASTACIAEGTSGRALDSDRTFGSDMTGKKCMEYCGSKGYAYSGVE